MAKLYIKSNRVISRPKFITHVLHYAFSVSTLKLRLLKQCQLITFLWLGIEISKACAESISSNRSTMHR